MTVGNRVVWVGHATVHLELDGLALLTDPLLTDRVAHLRRRVAPPPPLHPDVVLVSHAHMDHLHLRSLRAVTAGAHLVVPRGTAPLVRRLAAAEVHEVTPGDVVELAGRTGPVTLRVTPARHGASRGPHSRVRAQPVGYVASGGGRSVYFAGDTDLFDAMTDAAGVDLALLPIWGWGPTIGPGHLDPERAAAATELITPQRVIPIHWGTYSPARPGRGAPAWLDTPLGAFRTALTRRGLGGLLDALRPGEHTSLS